MKLSKNQYDERQLLDRGKAFRYGFFSCLAANCIMYLLNELAFDSSISSRLICFIPIWVSVVVFAISCIRLNAFDTLRTNKTTVMGLWLVLGLTDTVRGIADTVKYGITHDDCHPLYELVMGVSLLGVAAYYIIHHSIENKHNSETEE